MKQLTVLSGKGGTGKTTITASLAALASKERPLILVDADCEAANLGLLLDPSLEKESDYFGGEVAVIDPSLCDGCGICDDVCRFDAVERDGDLYRIVAPSCEGCKACFYACPLEAIGMVKQQSGNLFHSRTRFGPLFHARLLPAGENSGKVVSELRSMALARAGEDDLILIDGPPGVGCPAIASSRNTDLVLLVAEPTLSSISDLDRALEAARHFGIPSQVFLNKSDLHTGMADRIRRSCRERSIPIAGEIPYSEEAQRAIEKGLPLIEVGSKEIVQGLTDAWRSLAGSAALRS